MPKKKTEDSKTVDFYILLYFIYLIRVRRDIVYKYNIEKVLSCCLLSSFLLKTARCFSQNLMHEKFAFGNVDGFHEVGVSTEPDACAALLEIIA